MYAAWFKIVGPPAAYGARAGAHAHKMGKNQSTAAHSDISVLGPPSRLRLWHPP